MKLWYIAQVPKSLAPVLQIEAISSFESRRFQIARCAIAPWKPVSCDPPTVIEPDPCCGCTPKSPYLSASSRFAATPCFQSAQPVERSLGEIQGSDSPTTNTHCPELDRRLIVLRDAIFHVGAIALVGGRTEVERVERETRMAGFI